MKKTDLMEYIGKDVVVYLKGVDIALYGILSYIMEFSFFYYYSKPKHFYISNTIFKACHVKKVVERNEIELC